VGGTNCQVGYVKRGSAGLTVRRVCKENVNQGNFYTEKRENPAIADWVQRLGGSTVGMLGGKLAQRQAALRGLMAAGHSHFLYVPCVPTIY